jgi:drug/metabolite transporter (DMT)-like permease
VTFVIVGVSGFGAYNLLFVGGLARTSAFSAAVIISLAPVFTLLLAAVLRIETVRLVQWIGVLLSFFGILIFVGEKLVHNRPAAGDALNLLAAASFAVYGLSTQRIVPRYGAQVATAWSAAIGLVAVVPFTLPAAFDEDWDSWRWQGWIAVLYAAIVSMLLAYTLWSWAIGKGGAGRTVPYLFLIPVFTGVMAMIFLGDTIGRYQIIGAGFALAGVALARVPVRSSQVPAAGRPAATSS